jgi:C-terminal processing protease CtpA/Prc
MAMDVLPHVTLVGENSNGILSDVLNKALPNGWELGLSNEVYADHLGVVHEVTGVPPEVNAVALSLDDLSENRDDSIDASLDTLGFAGLARSN